MLWYRQASAKRAWREPARPPVLPPVPAVELAIAQALRCGQPILEIRRELKVTYFRIRRVLTQLAGERLHCRCSEEKRLGHRGRCEE